MLTLLILGVMTSGEPGPFQLVSPVRAFAPAFLVPRTIPSDGAVTGLRVDAARADAALPECKIRVINPDPRLDPKIARQVDTDFDSKIVRPSHCRK